MDAQKEFAYHEKVSTTIRHLFIKLKARTNLTRFLIYTPDEKLIFYDNTS